MKKLICFGMFFISLMLCGFTTYKASDNATIPFNADEIASMPYTDVAKQLITEGFTNVLTDEVYDVDPDEGSAYTTVAVTGFSDFEKNNTIPANTKIKITGHYPYEQHAVSITIDFEENWIFDKYGITLSLGKEVPISLEHGQSGTFEFAVPTGTYQLSFAHEKKSEIVQSLTLNVTADISADYHIACRSDKIELTENGIQYANELKSNEIKSAYSNGYFLMKDYKDCVKTLKKIGFTNVTAEAVTDGLWGITPAGKVTSVSIGNKKNFSYGDRFVKDAKVTVFYHIPTVTFSQNEITITEDDSFELTHTVSERDRPEDVEIRILDDNLVKKETGNQFTAIDPGETKIAAYYKDICLAECAVVVELRIIPISSISLTKFEKMVSVGEVFKLDYTIEPADANYTELQYQTSNDLLEPMDGGAFYSTAAGNTEITILQEDRVLGTIVIHAEDVPVEGITFDDENYTVGVGRTIEIPFILQPENATSITLEATLNNTRIAELIFDKKSEHVIGVTGKAPGKATITVKSENKLSAKKDITVTEILPEEITISTETVSPLIGTKGTFTVEYNPIDVTNQKVTWKSSAPNILRINYDGTYQAVSIGKAVVTATHSSGVIGSIDIEVLPIEVESITLSSNWDEAKPFYKNNTMTLTAEILPQSATDKSIIWTSSNDAVATVSDKGIVKAISAGTATITAKVSNGKSTQHLITVELSPQKFRVSASISMRSNDHVGNNWSNGFEFNDEQIRSGSTVSIMPGDSFTVCGWAQDNDSNPDYGSLWKRLTLTDEMCKSGFTVEGEADVRENGGRYRGNCASWYVIITFTPIN